MEPFYAFLGSLGVAVVSGTFAWLISKRAESRAASADRHASRIEERKVNLDEFRVVTEALKAMVNQCEEDKVVLRAEVTRLSDRVRGLERARNER